MRNKRVHFCSIKIQAFFPHPVGYGSILPFEILTGCLKKWESAGRRSGGVVDDAKLSHLFTHESSVYVMCTWICREEEPGPFLLSDAECRCFIFCAVSFICRADFSDCDGFYQNSER